MKAKELMIGDIVSYNGAICRVISTECFGNLVAIENDTICDLVSAEELLPIHLTPEILEANGWMVRIEQSYNKEAGMFLNKGLDGNAWWWQYGNVPICPINYVHELQHALRLCGLNELADNFNI